MADQVHDVYTGSNNFDVVVNHFGDARGIKDQFANSNPDAMTSIIDENNAAASLARGTVSGQLASIKSDLQACWEGENANNALGILATLSSDAETIATNTETCGRALATFQSKWYELRQRAMSLDTGVLGLGEDNSGAHQIYQEFNDAMNSGMHAMPSQLEYHTPLSGQIAGAGPPIGGGGGPGGGGGIPTGMGAGGGFSPAGGGAGGMNLGQQSTGMEHAGAGKLPSPGTMGTGPGAGEPGALNPGAPGTPGSYAPGAGGTGPASPGGAGLNPGAGAHPGGSYQPSGVIGGGGPGAVDPSTTLAGYHPGAMGGGAGGPGAGGVGAGGLGSEGGVGSGIAGFGAPLIGGGGSTDETRTSGIGTGSTAGGMGSGAAAGGTGAEAGAATGGRTGMMMPMRGGGSSDEDERERSTWLAEDDDVWAGESAPPGVIT